MVNSDWAHSQTTENNAAANNAAAAPVAGLREGRVPGTVSAIVAAAGKGTRLGAAVPKAFVQLRGRSLLARAVRGMVTSQVVDEIIVVVHPDMRQHALAALKQEQRFGEAGVGEPGSGEPGTGEVGTSEARSGEAGTGQAGAVEADSVAARVAELPAGSADLFIEGVPVRLVGGGEERADSVWEGVKASRGEVVIVHDAARALTPPGMIARVVSAVRDGAPAVIPVVPVADTIKEVAATDSGEAVVGTPVRANLRAVQTPQGFAAEALVAANEKYFAQRGFEATDDASLMEWFGVPVTCVSGDYLALKITTPIDMVLAEHILDEAEPTIRTV